MDGLFILLAISLPLLLVGFLIYRATIASKINYPQTEKLAKISPANSTRKTIGIILISVICGAAISIVAMNYNMLSLVTSKNNTKFSVLEFVKLMDSYKESDIAKKCLGKNFIEFSHYTGEHTSYDYYYVLNNLFQNPKDEEYEWYNKKCSERVTFWSDSKQIIYSIRKSEDYLAFIDSIKSNNSKVLLDDEKIEGFNNDTCYMINNCVFADKGYMIDAGIYSIYLFPYDYYSQLKNQEIAKKTDIQEKLAITQKLKADSEMLVQVQVEKQKADSLAKIKCYNDSILAVKQIRDSIERVDKLFELGGDAIITVKEAYFYPRNGAHPYGVYHKGNKIKITGVNGAYVEFEDNDHGTVYILKSDVKLVGK